MKLVRKAVGSKVCFVVTDVEPGHRQALTGLGFEETANGFARVFPGDASDLDRIFKQFERTAEEMILQAAGMSPVPWEEALLAFLGRAEGQDLDWWLVGSAALAVRGLDVAPRDLDLVVDGVGAKKLGSLLLDVLVEPVQEVRGWIANWFGRAFLLARIEWVGDVAGDVDEGGPRPFGPHATKRREVVLWRGHEIRVPPLNLQLRDDERRGLLERAEKIRRAMKT